MSSPSTTTQLTPAPPLRKEQLDAIITVLRARGIKRASIFGSYARQEQHIGSDIDLLIEPPPHTTLFDLARLQNALEDALGYAFDLVTFNELHPAFRERVLAQQKVLFDERA